MSELLNAACDVQRFATQLHVRTTLTESVVAELQKLAGLARDINIDSIPTDTLIQSDPQWAHAREQAQRCLRQIGFDLSAWEQREGLTTTNDGAN